jgi:hypothetical protein
VHGFSEGGVEFDVEAFFLKVVRKRRGKRRGERIGKGRKREGDTLSSHSFVYK